MRVPFLNLDREADILIGLGLMKDIEDVIRSGHFLFGPKATELEIRLSEMFNRPVVLVGSGTDALALSLKALGIGYGDRVAIPAFSAIPTAVAVKMIGAIPVYVDVDFGMTMCTNASTLKNLDVKAFIPVHLYGNPADIETIKYHCVKRGISLVEDCAQSFGATFDENLLGTFGMSGALSFYPTKNLGCMGDGGAVIACDEQMAKAIRELRFYGQETRNRMGRMIGMNSRMDEIQCAILIKKLQLFPAQAKRRIQMLEQYREALLKTPFRMVAWRKGALPHLFPIMSNNRDRVVAMLAKREVETSKHYPFHLMETVEGRPGAGLFSNAKEFSETVISLPFNPWMTDDEIDHVLKSVMEVGECESL